MPPNTTDSKMEDRQLISDKLLDLIQSIADSLLDVESWDRTEDPGVVKTRQVLMRMRSYVGPNAGASAITSENFATDLDALNHALAEVLDKMKTLTHRTFPLTYLYRRVFAMRAPSDIDKALRKAAIDLEILQKLATLEQDSRLKLGLQNQRDPQYPLPLRHGSIGRQSSINPPASKELIQRIKETIYSIDQRFDLFNDMTISDSNLARHVHFRQKRLGGTCEWFIGRQEFREWISEGDKACSTLVCWGRSGIGKSTIASRVIDELSGKDRVHAYYYLGNCGVNSAERLTASLLSQLYGLELKNGTSDTGASSSSHDASAPNLIVVSNMEAPTEIPVRRIKESYNMDTLRSVRISPDILPASDTPDEGFIDTRWSKPPDQATHSTSAFISPRRPFRILLEVLSDALSKVHDTVFIILDAWEVERMEPEGVDDFCAALNTLHTAGCRLFLTSRTEPHDLVPFTHKLLQVEDWHDYRDIEKFIRVRMQDADKIPLLPLIESKAMDRFCREVADRSEGSFTLAALLANNFRINYRSRMLRFYSRVSLGSIQTKQVIRDHIGCLSRLEAPISSYTMSTLVWLAFAITPIPFDDFWEPLQWVSGKLQARRQDKTAQNYEDTDMRAVIAQLEGLVVLDCGNELMQLSSEVGETIKSMSCLEEGRIVFTSPISGKEILGYICLYCIDYILDFPIENNNIRSKREANEILQKHPFLSHVVRCWAVYCREFDSRVMYGQQTREGNPFPSSKEKGLEVRNREAVYAESIEIKTPHNREVRSQELASLHSTVSARTSEFFECNAKIRMAILLATYLSPDSSILSSSWSTLSSWVTSMSDLAIASRLGLNREVKQRSSELNAKLLSARDSQGNTPLHEAIRAGFKDVVQTLLDAGAPVSAMNLLKMNPVEYAMKFKRSEIFVIIFERMCILDSSSLDETSELTAYYYSCLAGDQSDVKRSRDVALCHAVQKAYTEIAQKLLEIGADPNAFDDENIPVLHHAIRYSTHTGNWWRDTHCPGVLLDHGADPKIKSRDGKNESALHVAIRYRNLPVIERLLIYGADPCSTDSDGRPPIFALFGSEASHSNSSYSGIISELVGRGADLDQPDNRGRRALHLAAQYRLPYVIHKLIWMGADCNHEDKDGKTPLEYAQDTKDEMSIGILTSFTTHVPKREHTEE